MAKESEQEEFLELFGRRCRGLRQARGWTLEAMLSHGLSAQHYQKIEKGKKGLTLWTARRIAVAFDMSLSELLDGL